MRAYCLSRIRPQPADEIPTPCAFDNSLMKALGSNAILGLVVDMGMIAPSWSLVLLHRIWHAALAALVQLEICTEQHLSILSAKAKRKIESCPYSTMLWLCSVPSRNDWLTCERSSSISGSGRHD
jgi:hypothetical protein